MPRVSIAKLTAECIFRPLIKALATTQLVTCLFASFTPQFTQLNNKSSNFNLHNFPSKGGNAIIGVNQKSISYWKNRLDMDMCCVLLPLVRNFLEKKCLDLQHKEQEVLIQKTLQLEK